MYTVCIVHAMNHGKNITYQVEYEVIYRNILLGAGKYVHISVFGPETDDPILSLKKVVCL